MSEPLTTAAAAGLAAGSVGATFATFFPEATPAVMICALVGAGVYMLSSVQHGLWKQIAYAVCSFFGGVYCAGMAAQILTTLINSALVRIDSTAQINVPPAVGALVASVVSVTVLLRVLTKSKGGN